MNAISEFVDWLSDYTFQDRNHRLPPGLKLNIHSRSDAHSKKLAELVFHELMEKCELLRKHAKDGQVGYGINYRFTWPNKKTKSLDLAIGIPSIPQRPRDPAKEDFEPLLVAPRSEGLSRVLLAIEFKSALTEHHKSQPRIFDELNGSHAIVHAGDQLSIAGGLTLVNVADRFVSPLRQSPDHPVEVSQHDQPRVAANMVHHLRNLPRRTTDNPIGFDAYATFLVDVDNLGHVALWSDSPSPQPGDPDHFDTFINDLCLAYIQTFGDLEHLPAPKAITYEEALVQLAVKYPGLLDETGQLAVDANLTGSVELHAILKAIEQLASSQSLDI